MKKISCSFANHSGSEIGVDINSESFVIPGNSVGASVFTREINPGAVADIQSWLAANHPYVVFTNNGDGITDENNLVVPGASYPKSSLMETISLPSGATHLAMITADSTQWKPVILPATTDCKSVLVQVHDGSATSTDIRDNPSVFALSFDGGTSFTKHAGSFAFDMVRPGGSTICHVKAETGKQIAAIVSA